MPEPKVHEMADYRMRSEASEGYVFTGVCHSSRGGSAFGGGGDLPSEGGLPS